tara:strand:- start:374 stop:685 length:312 start_codon:yes stop_codon:yes gene_type:complete
MKGIDYRLLRAFLLVVVLVIATNFNFFFGKKKEVEPTPAPGPAPGPDPETQEEEEEEEEEVLVLPPVRKPKGMKTTVVSEIQTIDTLPAGIVKKEGYIGYSDI